MHWVVSPTNEEPEQDGEEGYDSDLDLVYKVLKVAWKKDEGTDDEMVSDGGSD